MQLCLTGALQSPQTIFQRFPISQQNQFNLLTIAVARAKQLRISMPEKNNTMIDTLNNVRNKSL